MNNYKIAIIFLAVGMLTFFSTTIMLAVQRVEEHNKYVEAENNHQMCKATIHYLQTGELELVPIEEEEQEGRYY